MDNIFLPNKKKEKKVTAQLATIVTTCWTRNSLFFRLALCMSRWDKVSGVLAEVLLKVSHTPMR